MTIRDRIDSSIDKTKGKTNQVAGDLKGDEKQKLKGHAQELKGHLKDAGTDIKESFKDR